VVKNRERRIIPTVHTYLEPPRGVLVERAGDGVDEHGLRVRRDVDQGLGDVPLCGSGLLVEEGKLIRRDHTHDQKHKSEWYRGPLASRATEFKVRTRSNEPTLRSAMEK
jgi:hypothetical protein